jgi:hypothetical protein
VILTARQHAGVTECLVRSASNRACKAAFVQRWYVLHPHPADHSPARWAAALDNPTAVNPLLKEPVPVRP